MSEIPFCFDYPIPTYFRKNGLLKDLKNLAFLTWFFSRCSSHDREIFHDNQKILLKKHQIIFGRRVCCEETGLTEGEVRNQQKRWENLGFIKKATNKTTNRFTIYEVVLTPFLKTNNQQNNQPTTNQQPTNNHNQDIKIPRCEEIVVEDQSARKMPAAPNNNFSRQKTEKKEEKPTYACLETIELTLSQKIAITSKYSEDEVVTYVNFVNNPKCPSDLPGTRDKRKYLYKMLANPENYKDAIDSIDKPKQTKAEREAQEVHKKQKELSEITQENKKLIQNIPDRQRFGEWMFFKYEESAGFEKKGAGRVTHMLSFIDPAFPVKFQGLLKELKIPESSCQLCVNVL